MPFRSAKQRRYLWANDPNLARRWTEEYGSEPVGRSENFEHGHSAHKPVEAPKNRVTPAGREHKEFPNKMDAYTRPLLVKD